MPSKKLSPFSVSVQLYFVRSVSFFSTSTCFVLFLTFLFKCFCLLSKSFFSTKSSISDLVAKFSYFNLAGKLSAVDLSNS